MDYKIKEVLKTPEYEFLKNESYRKDLIYGSLAGSISYGTNISGSDIDFRGIALLNRNQLLGFDKNRDYEDANTDTYIYSLDNIFKYLMDCNPSCLELLFKKEDHIIYNDLGKMILDNKSIFLSQLAIKSYNGYINTQIHRLKNATRLNNGMTIEEELIYEKDCLNQLITHFNTTRTSFDVNSMLFIYEDEKLLMDCNLSKYPVNDLTSIFSELSNILKSWNKAAKLTNREMDKKHLSKFMYHIIRLLHQEIILVSTGGFSTFIYNQKVLNDIMNVRSGVFIRDNGSIDESYFDLVEEYRKELNYAIENTVLPQWYDTKRVEELYMYLNECSLEGNYKQLEL